MPIEQELKDAAWHYANKVNVAPSSPNVQNYFTGVHNSFLAGAEWQSKKDEELLNGLFSREAVLEILYHVVNFKADVRYNNTKDMPIADWFNTNYPSKTE